jgi:hypothetical protein
LLREAGKTLDPFFARAFAGALGVFPVGSIVRLSDQTVGVVKRPGEDPLAPVVRLLYDERGFDLTEHPEIDLAAGFVRIVEVVPPDALNIEVSDTLVAEQTALSTHPMRGRVRRACPPPPANPVQHQRDERQAPPAILTRIDEGPTCPRISAAGR